MGDGTIYGRGNGRADTPEQTREMNESLPQTVHQEELLVSGISRFLKTKRTLKSTPESANGFKLTTRNGFHTHKHVSSPNQGTLSITFEFQLWKFQKNYDYSCIL
jgi:hypothetical protein